MLASFTFSGGRKPDHMFACGTAEQTAVTAGRHDILGRAFDDHAHHQTFTANFNLIVLLTKDLQAFH